MRFRREEVIHTEEELRALCVEWQETLRLSDWAVNLVVSRGKDMGYSSKAGTVEWLLAKKSAKIQILHRDDFPAGTLVEVQDHEKTLVHELLHLHHAQCCFEEGPQDDAQEIAIELTAQALVALKRNRQ